MQIILRCIAAAAMAAAASGMYAAGDENFSLTGGFDYSSGNYGEPTDTTIIYFPLTGRYETGLWIFGLTVPYLEVEGPRTVVRDIGRIGTQSPSGTSRESGLGDIVGSATYNLLATPDGRALDLTGKLKLGTGNRDKGLGTGENDIHVQLDGYRTIGQLSPFATLGYKFLGDPPGINLKNVFYYSIGASHKLDNERSVGAMWYGQQKTTDAGDPQSELIGYYTQKLIPWWKAQLYGVLGLANGSPDYGVGAMVTRSF